MVKILQRFLPKVSIRHNLTISNQPFNSYAHFSPDFQTAEPAQLKCALHLSKNRYIYISISTNTDKTAKRGA